MAGLGGVGAAAAGNSGGATADGAHLGLDDRWRGLSRHPALDSAHDDQLWRRALALELWDFAAVGGVCRDVRRRVHGWLDLEDASLAAGGGAGGTSVVG